MLKESYPFYLAGHPVGEGSRLPVTDKYTGEVIAQVTLADRDAIDCAIGAAVQAESAMASLGAYERRAILEHCKRRFEERAEEFAQVLCLEAGKPIRDSRGEVARLIDTFRIAAEESTRIYGEVLPLDISQRAKGYSGMWKRVPIGACSFISPFNFPLNLVAHKVAPALAVGCPFILKPASRTPLGALLIGEVLAECDLPAGAFSILPCERAQAEAFTTDERLRLLSFTGSPQVGWDLKAKAGKKKVILELGGNAAVIVDHDADLDDVVARILIGAFYQSGQSCISVQRILAHASIYEALRSRLVTKTRVLRHGNPQKEETVVGPMISEAEAKRVETWIEEATSAGATLLCGGVREGANLSAALLENVPGDCDLNRREVFGPVATLSSFDEFDAALAEVNNSDFGLQAGVFTRDVYKIKRAWDTLEVGGVIIGDVPSWRVDHMPYGGVKDSGIGREGVRFAMEDMTETRLLVLRSPS